MPGPIRVYVRGLGFTGWVMVLLSLALLVAILIAIAVVAAGIFLFLLPFMLISAVAFYFLPETAGRACPRSGNKGARDPGGGFHRSGSRKLPRIAWGRNKAELNFRQQTA